MQVVTGALSISASSAGNSSCPPTETFWSLPGHPENQFFVSCEKSGLAEAEKEQESENPNRIRAMNKETDPKLSGCCEIANIAGVTCRLQKYDSKYGYQCDDIEVSLAFFDQARIYYLK